MKTKQFRKIVADLFPVQYGWIFDRCFTARDLKLVADTLRQTERERLEHEIGMVKRECALQAQFQFLEAKLATVEAALQRATTVTNVREPAVPQEEVFLIPPPSGPAMAGDPPRDLRNKIGLIKAVRTVSDLGLKEAKDLVEDVLDKGLNRSVFKGSIDKAAVAVRVLAAAGGHTVRKEAF